MAAGGEEVMTNPDVLVEEAQGIREEVALTETDLRVLRAVHFVELGATTGVKQGLDVAVESVFGDAHEDLLEDGVLQAMPVVVMVVESCLDQR